MKICIINDFKQYGGAEQYVVNLRKILSDNTVNLLYSQYQKDVNYDENEKVIEPSFGKVSKVIFDIVMYRRIRRYLRQLNPDLIIVNNMVTSSIAQYAALSGYRTVQVVHDYGVVCPKSTCLTTDDRVCSGFRLEKCLKNCKYHDSHIVLAVKLLQLKVVSCLRNKYINKFITPSKKLAEFMIKNGYKENVEPIPNPCVFQKSDANDSNNKDKRTYLYVGGVNAIKGIKELVDGFSIFCKDKDVVLDIYGSISDDLAENVIASIKTNKIQFHGHVDNSQVGKLMSSAYALIVPSKWMENYPTTVLEGFSFGTLVIGSNRGGIPEMLADHRGIVFDFGIDGLMAALEKSYTLDQAVCDEIVSNGRQYLYENNSAERYKKRLMKVIQKLIAM